MDVLSILSDIRQGILSQIKKWNDNTGLNLTEYSEVIDSISNFDSSFGIESAINSQDSIEPSFKDTLMDAIKASVIETNAISEYRMNACRNSSIIYAPSKIVASANLSNCFYYSPNLTYVESLNTSGVSNMQAMFAGCRSLVRIGEMSCENVENASYMFENCVSIISFPNNFVFPKLNNANSMFRGCTSLRELPNGFSARTALNTSSMFINCINLEYLPEGFECYNSDNVNSMFSGCSKLRRLPHGFRIKNTVSSTNSMFTQCHSLGSEDGILDIGDFSSVDNRMMFNYCSSKNMIDPITEVRGVSMSAVGNEVDNNGSLLNTNNSANMIYNMFQSSKIAKCIFNGTNNIRFDCMFEQRGWQNLDLDSIISFIENCLADCSEDTNSHLFKVSASMKTQLQDTISEEWGEPYSDVLVYLGWDLQ